MTSLLRFENFSFAYKGSRRFAVNAIDFSIERGEIVVLAGPSGCGKTTLLRSINGLIPHMYNGEIVGGTYVDGSEVAKTTPRELAKKVGFVFQNPENQIFMFSVERDVAFGPENLMLPREEIRGRVSWALDTLGITDLAHVAPHELSDGQKQRVAIAGAIAMRPSLLLLDEPTSLLDPQAALGLAQLLKRLSKELGITVLIVEHRLELIAALATRIIVMNEGRIILDAGPRDALRRPEALLSGIGIPTASRLHMLLEESGLVQSPVSLTAEELIERIKCLLP